ncbi:hypothetical protein SO802_003960 [Lithocarpus litseifolius]|uniref:glutathione transferase n=1 Tax=Lithocarpus litseifolius TaxID=425828 RepID=A0AAW2E6W9_9ROSI
MVTPVKVYGPPMSTAVSRVLACLYEKNVEFELISINMSKGEHQKPEFLKLQICAIYYYMCDKHTDKGNKGLYGIDPLAKASIDQWIEAERQIEKKLLKVLDIYEKRLGEASFLAWDEFSLADLFHLPNTQYFVSGTDKGNLLTSRENVGRWWDEISSRDLWKKVK